VFVTKVIAPNGTVLYRATPTATRVLPANIARDVNGVMEQVVSRGTGINARIGRPVAGKTGTGQNWDDAWFVGSTPQLTTAVWVGFAAGERSMLPPVTREKVTGGTWPADIWGLFASNALAETPVANFPAPTGTAAEVVKTSPLTNVNGMPGTQASHLLNEAGYAVHTTEQPDREYPPGTVIAQQPLASTLVTPGTNVTLTLARVPDREQVPTVLGALADEASGAVIGHGLQPDIVRQAEPPGGSPSRAGRAWKQSPAGGAFADEGSAVMVWVNP
jgi:penicillin-binding protein 1A